MHSSYVTRAVTVFAYHAMSPSSLNVCDFAPRPSFVSSVNKIARVSESAELSIDRVSSPALRKVDARSQVGILISAAVAKILRPRAPLFRRTVAIEAEDTMAKNSQRAYILGGHRNAWRLSFQQ